MSTTTRSNHAVPTIPFEPVPEVGYDAGEAILNERTDRRQTIRRNPSVPSRIGALTITCA